MKLFLSSEAKHPDSMKNLEEFVGGLNGKTIAYIPTASNGEIEFGAWKDSATLKVVRETGADVTIIQLEDYKDERVVDLIKGKDIVWFGGGIATYLMYWILRCNLDEYLHEILESGTVYVGSSAGSMIASPTLEVESWYPEESNKTGKLIPGLGLVDFEIYPHYDESKDRIIKENYKGNKLYLLKNGEVIVVDGTTVKVLGQERVIRG